MKPHLFVAFVGLAGASLLHSQPVRESTTDRIARLIRQLGHDRFVLREAASKELDAIGEPALDALRKATTDQDIEIRQRAENLVASITGRVRAAATKKELVKWEGTWEGEGGEKMTFKGDRWTSGTPTFGPVSWTIKVVELRDKMTLVDLLTGEGPTKGTLVKAIVRVEGDLFRYCGTFGLVRPIEFKASPGYAYHALKRAKN